MGIWAGPNASLDEPLLKQNQAYLGLSSCSIVFMCLRSFHASPSRLLHMVCWLCTGHSVTILHKFLHLTLATASRDRHYYSNLLMRLRNLLHYLQIIRDGTTIWIQPSFSRCYVLKYMFHGFSYHAVSFCWCCTLFVSMSVSLPGWHTYINHGERMGG